MSDIEEQLRRGVDTNNPPDKTDAVMWEAAAEIGRLKAAMTDDDADILREYYLRELDKKDAEIERLTRRLSLAEKSIECFEADRINFEAEIERLRSLLANSEMTVAEVMAANERLRTALREIDDRCGGQCESAAIARAALEGK